VLPALNGISYKYNNADLTRHVRFQLLTAVSVKFRVFRDVAPCSHVEVDRRFTGEYCPHHQAMNSLPDDGDSTHL
jgi:hypothetical protein